MLVLSLFGFMPGAAPKADPALALAKAAGALCLADGPEGLPADHAHEHCLACRASRLGGTLAEAPVLPVPPIAASSVIAAPPRAAPSAGRPAYASRAPPERAG